MPLVDHFAQASSVAKSSLPPCEAISSPFRTPRLPKRSRAIHLSSILAMVRTRGSHTDPSASHEAWPSASAPQDPSQASQALTMPSSEGRVPSCPPQHRYSTRRPPISLPLKPSVCRVPPKRARTSGPREASSQVPANSQAPKDTQRSSGIAPEVIIKRPMVTVPPIPGNLDCRAKPFHSKLYFNM